MNYLIQENRKTLRSRELNRKVAYLLKCTGESISFCIGMMIVLSLIVILVDIFTR